MKGTRKQFRSQSTEDRKQNPWLHFLSWASSDTCLFVFYAFLHVSLYFLLTSALLWGCTSIYRMDAQAETHCFVLFFWVFLPKQTWGTLNCTDATDGLWCKASPWTVLDFWGTFLSHFGLLVWNHDLFDSPTVKESCVWFTACSMIILLLFPTFFYFLFFGDFHPW